MIFDSLIIHGFGGKASSAIRRCGLVTRWCGDDVTYAGDEFLLTLPAPPGITIGVPLNSDLFPVIWRRPGRSRTERLPRDQVPRIAS